MRKHRKRKRNAIMVPVASMGDIAFLLIIFFMVASQLARERHDVIPPRSLDAYKLDDTQISVTVDREGNIYLQGERVTHTDSLKPGIEALLMGRTGDKARTVLFRCDKSTPADIYQPALDAIVEAGGLLGLVGEEGEPTGPDESALK